MNKRKKAALTSALIVAVAICLYLITFGTRETKKSITIFPVKNLTTERNRVTQGLASDKSINCSLSLQDAQYIRNLLANVSSMEYINVTHQPYNSKNNETCLNTLICVQNSVEKISKILKTVSDNETGFNNALDLDSLERKCYQSFGYLEILVSLSKERVSSDAKDIWNECEHQVEVIKDIIERAISASKSRKTKFELEIIAKCVADIEDGLMFDALESYQKHPGRKTLTKIIRASYQNETLPNIFLFIDKLNSVMEKAQAYQSLVYEMHAHNDMEEVILLAIKSAVINEDLLSKTGPAKERTEVVLILNDIKQKIKKQVERMINKVANDIISEKHGVIVKEFKGALFQGVYPEEYLNNLQAIVKQVTSGGANQTNIQKLFSFTRKLFLRQRTQFFIELLKEMDKIDEICFEAGLALVLEARQVLGLLDYRYAQDLALQAAVKAFMNKYPKGLQKLVITSYVCLRSVKTNAFLNVRKPLVSDKGNQEHFVVTNHMKGNSWQGVQWQAVYYDAEQIFRIRTKSSNADVDFLLLHVSVDANTSEMRLAAGGSSLVNGSTWKLVDANWREDAYYVYNVFYEVYLAEGEVSVGSERMVITKRGQSPKDGNYLSLKIDNC